MRKLFPLSLFIYTSSCVQPLSFEDLGYDNLLVVDALITDKVIQQKVLLTRSSRLTDTTTVKETGATVWIVTGSDTQIDFTESGSGAYFSNVSFGAQSGETYQLHIQTKDEGFYESASVSMISTPQIDSIYGEFELIPLPDNTYGGLFHFYVDSHNNPENHNYFRWTWSSSFKLEVPTPARWKWLGGNEFISTEWKGANSDQQVQFCWKADSSSLIIVEDLLNESTQILHKELLSIESSTNFFQYGYSLKVNQYAISKESYDYWNLISETQQKEGSLSNKQVGTITGNIKNQKNSKEIVLGRFDIVMEQSIRRQFDPLEFAKYGFRRAQVYIENCDGTDFISTPPDKIGEFLDENGDGWILGYFLGGNAVFLRRRCADCTLYGVNKQPDFWQ